MWEAEVVDTTSGAGIFQIEVSSSNAVTLSGGATYSVTSQTTGTATEPVSTSEVPEDFALLQSYPNPFNPLATINFSVPQAEHVRLVVFDMLGREVGTLVDESLAAGTYEFDFEAGDLPSGTYIYQVTAGTFSQSRTMTLLK